MLITWCTPVHKPSPGLYASGQVSIGTSDVLVASTSSRASIVVHMSYVFVILAILAILAFDTALYKYPLG